jgi:hypothetical protein
VRDKTEQRRAGRADAERDEHEAESSRSAHALDVVLEQAEQRRAR